MIIDLILLVILIIIAIAVFKLILSFSGTAIKIIAHFIAGWLLLTLVNLLPGINIPMNIVTMAISGFGGVFGTVILVIFYILL